MPLTPQLTKFTTASPNVISFDSEDFASGESVANFYFTVGETSAGLNYNLFSQTYNSVTIVQSGAVSFTFDSLPFKLPRIAKGTAVFSAQQRQNGSGATVNVSVKVQHWDGTTATDISSTITSQNIPANTTEDILFKVPLTETLFAEGDTLRIIMTTAGANSQIGISPTNQTFANFTNTIMVAGVPFKIE